MSVENLKEITGKILKKDRFFDFLENVLGIQDLPKDAQNFCVFSCEDGYYLRWEREEEGKNVIQISL